ncbi:RVP_2 domain-containing protein, partial [Cephalotus follicularis]
CYKCDEKFFLRHKFKAKFFLNISDPIEDCERKQEVLEDELIDCPYEGFPKISLHALVGQVNHITLIITRRVKKFKLQTLIDDGSTHNFMEEKISRKLGLDILFTKPFKVLVDNGHTLLCSKKVLQVPLSLQAHSFKIDFFILPIKGAELVIGIQLLETLQDIITNRKLLTMQFTH